jgi:hypothetical protein
MTRLFSSNSALHLTSISLAIVVVAVIAAPILSLAAQVMAL